MSWSASLQILKNLRQEELLSVAEFQAAKERLFASQNEKDIFKDELIPPPVHHAGGHKDLVDLNPDHPGFADISYRNRRNQLAELALAYQTGEKIPDAPYSPEEDGVWSKVLEHLSPLHQDLVCKENLELQDLFTLDRNRVPQLSSINSVLQRIAGFRMEPVAGLVTARTFLCYLGRRVFLSTQYIRHHSRPFYTPEPDIIHELIGHAASLAHPGIAEVNRLLGKASDVATETEMTRLENVYWYTMEFGLVLQDSKPKAFGAGLLSSVGELTSFSTNAELLDWDLGKMAATAYDPTSYQSTLYVAPSYTRLLADLCGWLRQGDWRDDSRNV